MNAFKRVTVLALVAVAAVPALRAQIPGMPLFTNPRYATGLRIHADLGQPTTSGTSVSGSTVVQGGVTFALGPIGIGANVGMINDDFKKAVNNCAGCSSQTAATASALAQLRIMGGGASNLSLSVFGGASMQLKALDLAGLSQAQKDSLALIGIYGDSTKQLTIPVGAALGLKIPLGLASVNLWGAPRWNITKFLQCPTSGAGSNCPASGKAKFRWAVGADVPIFSILSVRVAYDTGKDFLDRTTTVWGVGASIGLGGMR
jgi:hypothetical protein